jgi:hypothetical protein
MIVILVTSMKLMQLPYETCYLSLEFNGTGNPITRMVMEKKKTPENQDKPGRKPIFAPGTALVRLQLAIPDSRMEKLRLLAAFRNVHQAVVLAELIEEGWERHHLKWMNQDLIHQSLPQSPKGQRGGEGEDP